MNVESKENFPRELTEYEKGVLNKLLTVNFQGKEKLLIQLKSAKVAGYCRCGDKNCKTIMIQVENDITNKASVETNVPVEGQGADVDGIPIMFMLFVTDGYMSALDIIKPGDAGIQSLPSVPQLQVF